MPNAFKLQTSSVGNADSAATIYTCPGSTETTVIGMNLANKLSTGITADVTLVNNDGDNIYIVKSAPIPTGSALVPIGGEQKLVLNASDILKVTSSDSDAIDVALSILEIS